MADLATLGVVVTTKGVKEAERELKGLGKAGETAEKGVKRVGPSIDSAAKAAKRGAADIERSAKRIGAALGAATLALATGVALAVKSAIDRADEISKAAQKIGVTTEALSRLQFAAQLSDVSIEQLQQGIGFLGRELDKNEPLLNSLGVSVRDAAGNFLKADEVFRRVAGVFEDLPDGIEKSRLAAELFGARVGVDLIPLLNQGTKGVAALESESDKLGNTISAQTGRAAEEFNDTLARVKTQLNGVFLEVASRVLPNLQTLATRLNDPAFREGFATIINGAADAALKVAELISELGNLTTFVSEELAARFGGPNAQDTVRVEQRIQRLKDTIKAIEGQSVFSPLSILDASELIPSDLISQTSTVIERLQSELEREENKLKLGLELNAQDVPKVQEAVVEAVEADEDALERLKRFYEEQERAAQAAAAARKAAGDAARLAAQNERKLARILEQGLAAQQELTASIQQGAADLSGPAAQAARAYADEQIRLVTIQEQLAAAGLLDAEAERQLAIAREQNTAVYERRLKAISEQKTQTELLIADMEFELRLMGLSNAEREREIALRYAGAEATDEQKKKIEELADSLRRSREATAALDDFRASFEDSVASVLDGSKSIKDAFEDFADAIIAQLARIVAQNLTASLFGERGQLGGGSFGGGLFDFFSRFLGGGRAVGGPVTGDRLYPVAEKGQPEVLEMYGRKYLIPGGDGEVTPLREGAGGGSTVVNQVIQVTGTVDGRSAYQIQREAKMRLDMVGGR